MNGVIVCVTMRPGMRSNLWRNYFQQVCRLPMIVVINGPSVAEAAKYADDDVTVVEGPFRNKAGCFQVGMGVAKEMGADFWLCWDDDDYYGPEYCLRYKELFAAGAQIVGQYDRYMKTSEGRLWELTGCHNNGFLMCTIGALLGRTASWADIPDMMGQEVVWQKRMADVPRTPVEKGHFAHCRYGNGAAHVWGVSDQHIALKCQGSVHDLGSWDPDVVDQRVKPLQREPVQLDENHWVPWTPDGGIARPITLRSRTCYDHEVMA